MSRSPQSVLVRALEAAAGLGPVDLSEIFTEDVTGWSPNFSISSLAELEAEFADRDDALSSVAVTVAGVDVIGNKAIAEWRIGANHTGPLKVAGDYEIAPTNRWITLAGATFAEFRGDRICAFRNYFDDAALMEQLMMTD
jgi:limonene-1,2-epoxide hydrolase